MLLADAVTTAQNFVTVLFYVYLLCIIAYILTSWVPLPYNVWLNRVQRFLYDVVDPYLRLFRRLLPQLSVLENVLVPALAEGSPSRETIARAQDLLGRVGLGERLAHRPAELSGGERQRAGVARALLLKPALLLADEPTGNLDRKSAAAIGELLVEMQRQENTMLLVVTHSAELAAHLDRRYEIDDGRLVECR